MLSLIELQGKRVEAKRKRYDKDEMDAYLELVFENYRQLLEQNKQLEAEKNELDQKIKKLSDGVQYYRSIETTLQKALILAEKTSKETKDAALLKAEAIEKDANKRADDIIRTAEGEYNKIKGKCVQLVQQFNQYKHQLIEAASAQLEMVEGDEFDISSPDDYEKNLADPVEPAGHRPAAPNTMASAEQAAQKVRQTAADTGTATAPTQASQVQQTAGQPSGVNRTPKAPIPEDILTADTIDLGATLGAVRSNEQVTVQQEQAAATVEIDSTVISIDPDAEVRPDETENQVILDGSLRPEDSSDELSQGFILDDPGQTAAFEIPAGASEEQPQDVAYDANVVGVRPTPATVVEPVQAKTVEPKNVTFEAEFVDSGAKTTINPNPAPKTSDVPTLDALLQDLNLNNKNNQKSDDPFEFLGSTVDDF